MASIVILASKRRPGSILRVSSVRVACAVVLFVLLCAAVPPVSSVNARDHEIADYALIYGTVWGPDNQPVYGVNVKIRRATEKKARWQVFSDHSGEFAQRVPAGQADYVLWADLKSSQLPRHLKLRPGPQVNVHVYNDEREDTGVHLSR
jgi:hypothetical protein